MTDASLLTVPLDALHRELGAKMVPFAGYAMPVQYRAGILAEHQQCRSRAALFDVSHMGQVIVEGPGSAALLESLMPADLEGLASGSQTYSLLTRPDGGVIDDLIVTRWASDCFYLVINASRKAEDLAHLRSQLRGQQLTVLEDRALLALQGPQARGVLTSVCAALAEMPFMHAAQLNLFGIDCWVTCSGYTGEDGFEISVPAAAAEALARALLAHDAVEPAGLGARDSLRLEAGLCLYGHELSEQITPIMAGLQWAIAKARRIEGARAGGFPGAEQLFQQTREGTAQRRVGLLVEGRRPVREGQVVVGPDDTPVGTVSSGAFSATLGQPIAMAFVDTAVAAVGSELSVMVRDTAVPVRVVKMPFVPQRYFRGR